MWQVRLLTSAFDVAVVAKGYARPPRALQWQRVELFLLPQWQQPAQETNNTHVLDNHKLEYV